MVEERKAPYGYKITEVGTIPEDWDIYPFGDYLDIFSGKGFSKSEYSSTGTKLIRIDNVSYGKIKWDTIAYLPNYYKEIYSSLCLYEGDLLLALNRPITNGRLKLARLGAADVPSILYQRVGKIVLNSHTVNHDFAFYILNKFITEFVEKTSVGSDQPFISTTKLKKMIIVSPPLHEQKAIAEALANTDNMILSIEKLIDKKKKIKQGAIQQLLTGKKRLPGFDGEWKVRMLGEIIEVYRGGSPRPIQDYITTANDGVNWIKIGDVRLGAKYIESTDEKIKPEGIARSRFVKSGDVLLSNSMSFGRPYILRTEGCIHDGWLVLKNFEKLMTPDFLYYLLSSNTILNQYRSKAAGSGVLNLNKDLVSSVNLFIPIIEEQNAIAQVLSDMDDEIEVLEEKLEKYKTIKQGMMQELLTGRIRLI